MMEPLEENITRSHEHYLRHLLLLGQAAPIALNALIKSEETNRNETINDTIKKSNNEKIPLHLVHTKPDSWSTRTLCDVICILYGQELSAHKPEKLECIHVIIEQRKGMDNYAQSAALPFEVFEKKWKSLHDALLEIIKDIDDHASYECKRMIISFQSEPIEVNLELIKKMKETTDVDTHVQMAIQDKVITKIHGRREDLDNDLDNTEMKDFEDQHGGETEDEDEGSTDEESPQYETPFFTEHLRDTFVYVSEPTILTCKLSTTISQVQWRKNYKPVDETDTLKFVNDQFTHWLAISNAQHIDTGHYSCVCGNVSTSASLKVLEKPLKVVKNLHVDPEEAESRENMDVCLVCVVNLHARKPVWRHNNNEVIDSKRMFASSLELEHKLTILNARFEDEGDYTVDFGEVTSSTILTIKGNVDLLHKKQLTEELYRNWVRGALALKYLKVGLEQVSDHLVRYQHSEFLSKLSTCATICTQCTAERLLPLHNKTCCKNKHKCLCLKLPKNRVRCPNGFCSRFYDLVVDNHRYFDPVLSNTEIPKWSSDPWSVGACYITTTGYKGKQSATEVDCSGLLSLFINNMYFHTSLGDVDINGETDVFKQAKDARNDILHNPRYELSNGQLDEYIALFTSILEIKDESGGHPLLDEPGVKPAIHCLNELQNDQIDIYVSGDLEQHIKSLREHSMNEVAEKFEAAEKEKDKKIQELEEKLKQTEKELQLMNELRTSLQKKKYSQEHKVPFELEVHIQVLRTPRDPSVQANKRIFRFMKVDVARHYNKPEVPVPSTDLAYTKTSQTVHRLLGYIFEIEYAQIADVLNSESCIDLKIRCFSCKAIDQVLALINGTKFKQDTFELRKCLEMEGEAEKTHDVVACCSLQSINETRQRLYDGGLMKELTPDFNCGKHRNMRIVWFCPVHDKLCCSKCRETNHRACRSQVLSVKTYGKEEHKSLSVKSKIGSYNVKIYNQKGVTDGYMCSVLKTCKLPKGKFLIADRDNSRLKKLDSFYKLVGHCDLPDNPYDVCFIGDKTAAVSLGDAGIQLVNVSGKMKLKNLVKLDHVSMGLDYHGDKVYVTSREMVCTYKTDITQQRVLYKKPTVNEGESLGHVVVSDDGKMIYMSDVNGGLVTVDSDGTLVSTLKNDVLQGASGVCLVDDGTVLVTDENSHSVHQVDYKGERVLGTVITESECPHKPWSVYYDGQQSRLTVGYFSQNHITVFELQ